MTDEHTHALDPQTFGPDQPCFGCGPRHPIGFHLEFAREGDVVVTRFTPGERYQGPPGIMHGGLVMTLADELAAWTIIGLRERFGFTATVDARFVRPVRIGVEIVARGRFTRDTPRLAKVAVSLEQAAEEVFRGEFTFVILDQHGAAKMLGTAIPEAWKKFCR